jgi:MarR family transcriptional regulator for hemolysin
VHDGVLISVSKALSQLRQTYSNALLQAGRHWRRAADAMVKEYGLSDATAFPLVLIGRLKGEPRQNQLAEAMGIEGPTLVRLLDQLCSAGLIIRKEDPMDRRAKVLSLTKSGQILVTKIEADLSLLRERVFANVSVADLQASLRVFKVLEEWMDQPDGLEAIHPCAQRKEPAQ